MTVNVVLKEILKNRTYPEGGSVLYSIAEEAINNGNKILLDMIEVDSVPTLFMNTSFGDLIINYGINETKSLFIFNNISRSQLERIQKYFNDFQTLIEKKEK
jgi:preprotein translocase subunit SecY